LHIARANFIEDIDRESQVHTYYETHAGWYTVTDNLPKYQKNLLQKLREED